MKLLLKAMLKSKKFWYMLGSIVIPIIARNLGMSEDDAEKIWQSLIALIFGQGVADIGVYIAKYLKEKK